MSVASIRSVASRVRSKTSSGVVVRCDAEPVAGALLVRDHPLVRGQVGHQVVALGGVGDADVLRAEQRLEGDVGARRPSRMSTPSLITHVDVDEALVAVGARCR